MLVLVLSYVSEQMAHIWIDFVSCSSSLVKASKHNMVVYWYECFKFVL
jgi:hypothetical protein